MHSGGRRRLGCSAFSSVAIACRSMAARLHIRPYAAVSIQCSFPGPRDLHTPLRTLDWAEPSRKVSYPASAARQLGLHAHRSGDDTRGRAATIRCRMWQHCRRCVEGWFLCIQYPCAMWRLTRRPANKPLSLASVAFLRKRCLARTEASRRCSGSSGKRRYRRVIARHRVAIMAARRFAPS